MQAEDPRRPGTHPARAAGDTSSRERDYLRALARAFVLSPDDECEPYEVGGILYDALVCACERVGDINPQDLIDEAIREVRGGP